MVENVPSILRNSRLDLFAAETMAVPLLSNTQLKPDTTFVVHMHMHACMYPKRIQVTCTHKMPSFYWPDLLLI